MNKHVLRLLENLLRLTYSIEEQTLCDINLQRNLPLSMHTFSQIYNELIYDVKTFDVEQIKPDLSIMRVIDPRKFDLGIFLQNGKI